MTFDARKGSAGKWSSESVSGAPRNQEVRGIAIDPSNHARVVAVYAGFSGPHVFRTVNNGKTWKNISGTGKGDNSLPDLPTWAVVLVPSTSPQTIVVGSDAGVFQSADGGKTWQVLGTGLPAAPIRALALDYDATHTLLCAGTFGRSAFELAGSCPLCPAPPVCKASTNCFGELTISCVGPGVGITCDGNCHDNFGEPIDCAAGFTNSTTVTAGGNVQWIGAHEYGMNGLFLNEVGPTSAQACTRTSAGESCIVVDAPLETPCSPVVGNGPKCPAGYRWCTKYSPPQCVPENECTVTSNKAH